jgi:hypothetical protein
MARTANEAHHPRRLLLKSSRERMTMATIAGAPTARLNAERIFFSGMGVAMLITAFAGFAPTYFLLHYLHGVTQSGFADGATLTPLVHVHAIVFSTWMALFVVQTGLISAGRPDLHRQLGLASVGVGLAVIVLGIMTAITAGRLSHHPPGWNSRAFLMIPLASVAGFAIFAALGIANRKRATFHKRMMLIATLSMLIPAGARLAKMAHSSILPAGPMGGMMIANLFLAALAAFDFSTRGRLHPVTLWGGGLFLASQPLRVLLSQSAAWQGFAALLIG